MLEADDIFDVSVVDFIDIIKYMSVNCEEYNSVLSLNGEEHSGKRRAGILNIKTGIFKRYNCSEKMMPLIKKVQKCRNVV